MKLHRPIIHKCLARTIKKLSPRMNRPISGLCLDSFYNYTASRTRYPREVVSNIRLLSDLSKNKIERNQEDLTDAVAIDNPHEVDVSMFTEEVPIYLPDLGETSGKVLKWHKKEGDLIRHGDTLCDIETELFTFGMDTDDECLGILGKISARPNEKLAPNSLLCVVLHQPDN